MALAPEEEERLKERYADNRLTPADWDRIHSDYESAERILGEGADRRRQRHRARAGLPPEHSDLLSNTDRRHLVEQAAKRFQDGANAAVEGFIHLFESLLDKAVDKAVTKALVKRRGGYTDVEKRITDEHGRETHVHETHRPLGPDAMEVNKTIRDHHGNTNNVVEIHRKRSA